MLITHWPDFVSLLFFLLTWWAYSLFAKQMAKQTQCLSSVLILFRIDWMKHLLDRENRMLDAALLGNMQRTINFFASTTLLIIAGVLTALSTAETLMSITSSIPWAFPQSIEMVQFKLFVICLMLVFAFFKFTWALRQYSFAEVMIGAAPLHDDKKATAKMKKAFSRNTGKLIDQGGHNFNNGLRTYYFMLATIGWFLHPVLFVTMGFVTAFVLYRREFHSRTLKHLIGGLDMSRYYLDQVKKTDHRLSNKEN